MQRTTIILAYFFVCVNSISQQYPFIHYTPNDGLISNSIRNIYQDSKGRLYFTSWNGLSVYDGSRFYNYNTRNGLKNDNVNCIIEMGEDSIWIATNTVGINCLVNGKLKMLALHNTPLIDFITCDEKGVIYVASEDGLFLLDGDRFVKLPFIDSKGRDVGSFIHNIIPVGKYLLICRDNSLVKKSEDLYILYLFDTETRKIVAQTQHEEIHSVTKAPDGRIWISTLSNLLALETAELNRGEIVLEKLPGGFGELIKKGLIYINFDERGNFWASDKVTFIQKVNQEREVTTFSSTSGLRTMQVSDVFLDREGTTWIASEGVYKLINSNFSSSNSVFGITAINSITFLPSANQLYFYSITESKIVSVEKNKKIRVNNVRGSDKFQQIIATPKGLFGYSASAVYKLVLSKSSFFPEAVFIDTNDVQLGNPIIDKNGNLLFFGKNFITVLIDGKNLYREPINYFVDQGAADTAGNIWVADRNGELMMFEVKSKPSAYLESRPFLSANLGGIYPRSIVFDKKNNIWIGTRFDGIYMFRWEKSGLVRKFRINSESGLSDNFIHQLSCDNDNNIYACSPSGLDRIYVNEGLPVIENITRQNSIYQKVHYVVIEKDNTVWGYSSEGVIKISPGKKQVATYSPTLMVSLVKTGRDTISDFTNTNLSYKKNNLSFYVSATSFLDEKQIMYSYRLNGGSQAKWSEPSNNSTFSFIDLLPGEYALEIKASFPAGRYTDQLITYRFSILPPWWQTWWFRIAVGLLIGGLTIATARYYIKRKLEKQMAILERHQAIERERTRIATDIHDDLGTGLTRIKFITENIEEMTNDESLRSETEKLKDSSNELVEKMTEIIWAMNEKNNSLEDLVFYFRSYSMEYCNENKLECEFIINGNLSQKMIEGHIRRNVFLVLKESLHNIVKHASASKVKVNITIHKKLTLSISDNGKGLPFGFASKGNGLLNMKKRAGTLQGELNILNGAGTTIQLEIPL